MTDEAFRDFMHGMILRWDQLARSMDERTNAVLRGQDGALEESRRFFARMDAKIEDHRAETRAQTQALFRLLDRLDGGGAAA